MKKFEAELIAAKTLEIDITISMAVVDSHTLPYIDQLERISIVFQGLSHKKAYRPSIWEMRRV